MFGLSMSELIVIALVILFVVGPKRLPDVAKSIGKGYGEFKRTLNEMKQSVNMDDNNVQYSKRKTQTELANTLNVNRSTVCRRVKKAIGLASRIITIQEYNECFRY